MSPDSSMGHSAALLAADVPARVAEIAPAIAAAADRIERERRLPPDILALLYGANMFRLLAPKSIGGEELDPIAYFRTMVALGAVEGSTAWCIGQGNGCAMAAAYVDPAVARAIWGQPDGVVAWGPGKGEAMGVDGGYRVSGGWQFCSGSRHASFLGGLIYMPDAVRGKAARTMLIPVGQTTQKDVWDTIGLRGTGTDAFEVKDVFVPKAYAVVRDDPLDRREPGPLFKFASGALYGIGFSAIGLGMASALLEDFKALAGVKTPRRGSLVIRESQIVQNDVGVAQARLGAAKAFVLSELADIWPEAERGELSMDSRMRMRLATTHAIFEAKAVGEAAYDAAGATAVFKSSVFERRFRDLRTLTQQGQGRKSNFAAVGGYLLGLEPDTTAL